MRVYELVVVVIMEILLFLYLEVVFASDSPEVIELHEVLWNILNLLVGDLEMTDRITQVEVVLQTEGTILPVKGVLSEDDAEEIVADRQILLRSCFSNLVNKTVRVDRCADKSAAHFESLGHIGEVAT